MKVKFDLSKFKVKHKDKKTATLVHPSGHTVTVARDALHPMNRKNFDEIPDTEEPKAETRKKLSHSDSIKPKMMAGGGEAGSGEDIPYDKLIPQEQADNAPYGAAAASPPAMTQMSAPAPAPQSAMPEQQEAPESSAPQNNQVPPAAAGSSEPLATNSLQSAPAMPNNPDYMEGYNKVQSGIQQQAQAEGQAIGAKAEALKTNIAAQQDLQQNFQHHYNDLNKEREAFQHDIMNGHVDPNHYMGSMNTAQKLSTAIGLALGGMGSSITGAPNAAMDFLNRQIDRDIEAQKAELGKRETLLSANMRQFGNLNEATQMTKMMMNDMAKSQVDLAGTKAGSDAAKARASQLSGQIEMQSAPMAYQLAMRRMVSSPSSGMNSQDPAQLVTALVPPDKQKEVFGQIEAAQNTKHMGNDIMKSFDQAVKENTVLKTGAGLVRTPASVYALHQSMQPTFKDLEGTVRQAAMDNTFKNITPMPGDSQHTIDTKRQALEGYLQSKSSAPMAKGFGIDLSKFDSTAPMQHQEVKVYQGHQYQKVPGGWKRVK